MTVRRGPRVVLVAALLCGLASHPLSAQFPSDSAIRAIIKERVDSKRSSGIVVGLLEPSGRTRIFAYNEQQHGEPVFDGRSVFEIGSITKVFTTSILADMVANGEVTLDDPVAKYLPPTVKVPARNGKQITLQDLATQSSGLPRMPTNFKPANAANPYADYTAEQMFEFLSSYELTRDIGERYEYSNLGVGLLGQALARRAGMTYEQLVTTRILKPLGMNSSAITFTADMKARLAVGHSQTGAVVANWDLPAMAGAGALRSTVEDMLRFMAAQLNPTASTLARNMQIAHAPHNYIAPGMKIGLAWHVFLRPDRQIHWHNGGTGGYRSWAGFDLKNNRAAVILTNSGSQAGADDIGLHLLDPSAPLAAAAAPAPVRKEIAVAAAVLEQYAGEYELAPNFTLTITREGDQLFGQATGQARLRLWAETETDFFLKEVDAQVRFAKDSAGKMALTLFQGGQTVPGRKTR